MGNQWLRSCTVTVGGVTISDPLRIRFTIKQRTIQSPDTAIIKLTNLANATAQSIIALAKPGSATPVVVTAGYQTGSNGIVFKGEMKEARVGRENPTDTLVTVWAAGGDAHYNYGVVNQTVAAGSTHQDQYNALMQVAKKFGITPGYVPPGLLTQVKFPRSIPLYGMTRDHFRKIASAIGCSWSVTDNKLDLVPLGQGIPGGVTVLNANTGMIGMPMQTPAGVTVRCLINPALRPKQTIQLNNASIQLSSYDLSVAGAPNNTPANMGALSADGKYIILAIDLEGDTRGTAWYQDLVCYAANGPHAGVKTNASAKSYTT